MQNAIAHTTSLETSSENGIILEYAGILTKSGASFIPAEYYWQVGNIAPLTGWVIHLSVIRPQIPELLHAIVRELLKQSIPFKVIRDYHIAGLLLDGNIGGGYIGKTVSVYPGNNEKAISLAKRLIDLTKGLKGPDIPTGRHLGSVVYANYEEYTLDIEKTSQMPIPFKLPPSISWPFENIAIPIPYIPPRLLNGAYYPVHTIKRDFKGDVMRALYFKKFWQIKHCIIKQGRKNMFADDASRDIRARLQWQYDLYKNLASDLPVPTIFDYFMEGEDTYLAMEFIKGIPLSKWISNVYYQRIWRDLPYQSQSQLLNKIIEILGIVNRLHQKGYIHRDITLENFIIDNKDRPYLIDMELTWCSHTMQPDPPFKLGTPGFMSPEQYHTQTPTSKEDIYGLGGLMLSFFTNLSPVKFEGSYSDKLSTHLNFFIGDPDLSNLVAACLEPDPTLRPELEDIQKKIIIYLQDLRKISTKPGRTWTVSVPLRDSVLYTIQRGLNALSMDSLLTPKKRWYSRSNEKQRANSMEFTLYTGFHTGMAGPLWLVSQAKMAGFNTSKCQEAYFSSWNYIREYYVKSSTEKLPGLYTGTSGVAVALAGGLDSGLLQSDTDTMSFLHECFVRTAQQPDIADGWAGEGIAILKCRNWLGKERSDALLKECLNKIITLQRSNGSWDVCDLTDKKGGICLGMAHGVTGIIWFLLAYLKKCPDKNIEIAACKALEWLIKKAKIKNGVYNWHVSTTSHETENWDFEKGIPGIILLFLKAYEVLKAPVYNEIVDRTLTDLHPRTLLDHFSLQAGMAGLGELYLEAYRILGNEEFKKRADWIVEMFLQTFQEIDQDLGLWLVNPISTQTADLFDDNSGVLHFMMRHQFPGNIKHPLSI